MADYISDIAFTPSVKAVQEHKGSRSGYAQMEEKGGWSDVITNELVAFLQSRDSFYLATASKDGQPYIQHRGGLPGFLKVIDEHTLAFADFQGNRQYISAGNLAENDKAYIFLMDYPGRRRIKIWGTAKVVDDDAPLLESLIDDAYDARPEQAIVFNVKAWDRNCPQHITPRYSEAQVTELVAGMTEKLEKITNERNAFAERLGEPKLAD
ncbi:MAG: pyridoxamine 5'-phosphate oxidase family protein [Rhodospirillales bacterium]|nr:pyridoxamine 5'-phosphate oxidase family protein [Rhodospirillales bacterium]